MCKKIHIYWLPNNTNDMITKEELNTILEKMPETVRFNESVEWYTKPLTKKSWFKMKNVSNIFEAIPDKALDGTHLSKKYDNAYFCNQGVTPSIEDYEQLFNDCGIIQVEDDGGVLLKKDGKYIYFKEGKYWTSSFERNDVEQILPIHIVISKSGIESSQKQGFRSLLNIMPIKKL